MNESLRNNPFEAFDWLSEEPEAPVKAKEYVTQSQSVDEAYEAFDWLTEEESPVASPALNQSQSTDEAYEAFDWLDTSSPPPVQEQPTPPEYAVKPPEMPADETLAVDGVPSPRNPFDAPFALALDTGETPAPTTSGPGITSTEPFVPPQSTMPPEMDEALRAQYGKREEGLPLPGIGALLAPVETLGVEGVPIDGIPSQPMTVEQGGPFGGMMPGGGIGDPVPIEQPGLPLPGIGDTAEMAWEIANQAFEKTLGISPKQELKAVTDYGKWLYDTPKRVKEYVTTPGVQRDAPDRSRMGLINDELQAAGDWIGTFGQQLREEPDKPWRVFNLDSKEGKKLVEVDRILSESLTIPMLGTPLEAAESIGIAYMYMGGKPAIKTLKNISFKSPKQTFQDIKWAMDFKGVWQNARNLGPDIRHGAFKDAMFIHNNFPNKLSADRVKYIQNRGRGRPGPPLTAQDQRMIELFKKYPESANYWTKNGFKRPSVIQSILHQKLALPVDPKKESFETTARQQTTFVDPDANKTPKKITVAHRIPSPSEGQLKDRIDRIGDQIVKLGGFDAPQTPQLTQLTGQLSQAQTELAKVVNTSELEANPTVESVSEKMMRNETLNLNEQQVRANNAEKVEELLQAQAIAPGIPIKPPNAPATELSGSTPPIPPTDQVVVGGDMGVGAKAVTDGTRVQPTELDLGKQIAALVKDPRNITKEEWKSPELNKLYNELDPEVWEGAKTTALAIKEESGDIPSRFNVPPDGVSATQDIPTDPFTKFGFKDHVKAVDVKENKKELTKILEGIGEKFNSTGPPSSAAIARKINKFRKSLPEEKYPASSDLARDTEVLPHEIVGIAKDMLKTQASQAGVAMDLRKTGPDLTRVNVRVALKDIIANKDKATKPYTEDVLNLIRGKIYESRGLAEEVDFGEVKQKEKAPYIPFVPQPGIDPKSLSPALDIAMENPMIGKGGLRTVGSKGEYDTLPSAIDLGDFGPKVYGGTTKPDQLAMMLVHAKLLDDGDTSKMGELLKREYAAVKAQRAYNKEREDYGFEYDEWIQNRSYDITGDKLKVGDEFKIFGADNKVIKESEQAVQIKDENGRTTWLPFEGEEGKIRIDKGSLISPEKPVAKPAVSKAPPGELDLGVEKEDITKVIDQKADELVDAASKAGIELNLTEARKQAATIIGRQQASRQTKETGPVSKQGSLNMGTDDLPLFGKPPTQVPPVEGGVTKPVEMYHATETSGPLQISDRNLQHNKYGKGLSVTPHQDLAGRYAEGQEAGSVRKVNVDTGKVFQLDPKPPTILDLGQEAVPTGGFDKDGKTQFAWKKRTLASEDHPDRVSYSDFLRTEKDQFGDNPLLPQITKLGLSKKDLQGLDYSNNRALWDSMVKHFEKQGEKIPAEKARQVIEALGYDSIYHNQGKDEYYNVFKLDKVKPLTPQTTTKPTDITEGSRRLDQAPTTPLAQEALNSLNPTGTVFAK